MTKAPWKMEKRMKNLRFAALAALVLAGIGGTVATAADASVIPPKRADYGQLGATWWKWALSIPASENPILDPPGANCAVHQTEGGPWFLAGTNGASPNLVTRTCTIPRGRTIFFPIVTYNNTYPCPGQNPTPPLDVEKLLTEGAKDIIATAEDLHARLDEGDLPTTFRGTSKLYTVRADSTLTVLDPCIATATETYGNLAVADGYWLLLGPLSPGQHTLSFGGTVPGLGTVNVKYKLTVLH